MGYTLGLSIYTTLTASASFDVCSESNNESSSARSHFRLMVNSKSAPGASAHFGRRCLQFDRHMREPNSPTMTTRHRTEAMDADAHER